MNAHEVGDWVLIRAQVVKVHGSDIGYAVELFSKTDQYEAYIRPDLVVAKTDPPPQPEPDREYLIKDRAGDFWRWSVRQSAWECITAGGAFLAWGKLVASFGPVAVYGDIS